MDEENKSRVYTFGEYIRSLRADKNWSLKLAAEKMGMPSQKLCDIESGRRYGKRVNIDLVQRASKAYGISVADIFRAVQTTLSTAGTTEEVLQELIPLTRMTEMLSFRLRGYAESYPKEVEELATEIHANLGKIQVLAKLIQHRSVKFFAGDKNG